MKYLLTSIYFIFHKKQIIRTMKPKFVFWYLMFDGDHDKIVKALRCNYGLSNKENYDRVMKDVNLDDYLFILEKGFKKYCCSENCLIVHK